MIVTDAISHWRALGRWTPQFFKTEYGHLSVKVDDETMVLGDLIDRIEASTPDAPAPYLHNQLLADWPPELFAEVLPMPQCSQPNWLESRFFPSRNNLSPVEAYIGGRGARFPRIHYDGWHTHAFLMQLYGDKEYVAFAPDQDPFMCPLGGREINKSQVTDAVDPDLEKSRCSIESRICVSNSTRVRPCSSPPTGGTPLGSTAMRNAEPGTLAQFAPLSVVRQMS